ncbi:MAG: S8 family serine peptidase [Gemmatimonadota bacterium]
MSLRYVILRGPEEHQKFAMPKATRRGMRGAVRGAAPPATLPRVEVGEFAPRAAAELARKPEIMGIAPVFPMKLIAPLRLATGAGELSAAQTAWGVEAVGAHTSPFTGNGIVVAVLDTGVDAAHRAFAGVEVVRRNFTDASDEDEDGHGTHCTGTILGRDVEGKRIGVARGVTKLLAGKVLGGKGGGSDVIIDAIQWAVSTGANVISMSLGMDFPGYVKELEEEGVPTELATSMALDGYRANLRLFERLASFIAAQEAFARSALLVAAAGNESRRDENPDFQIAVSPPAVADGFISVAAVGNSPQGYIVAPFSNVGARLAAPGVDIVSARRGGGVTSMSGTSMATPHVAGVAALWAEKLSKSGPRGARQLSDNLTGRATMDGMASGMTVHDVGNGMVQAPQS